MKKEGKKFPDQEGDFLYRVFRRKKKKVYYWTAFLIIIFIILVIFITRSPNNESKENIYQGTNLSQIELNQTINQKNESEKNCSEKLGIYDLFSYSNYSHWSHMPLLVYINQSGEIKVDPEENNETIKLRTTQIREAMSRLSFAVPSIKFIEINDFEKADIIANVYMPTELRISLSEGEGNTGGLSAPSFACDSNLIRNATIYIHPAGLGEIDECTTSDLALHELMHAFAIGHSSDFGGLMAVSIFTDECPNNQISEKHIACLKEIYSNENTGACEIVKMLKNCGEGYVQGGDYNCHKECSEGYVMGQDYKCYEECGEGYYCLEGYECYNELCY